MTSSAEPTRGFASTQWSIVVAARSRHTEAGEAAMAALCGRYWRPLYSYVRRRGYSTEDAQDLTQAYFARLLEKNFLDQADAGRGKFRSFLLASLKHFLANEWDRANAVKRGGRVEFIGIEDVAGVEREYGRQALGPPLTPEQLYERNWAITVLSRATVQLAAEFAAAGSGKAMARRCAAWLSRPTAACWLRAGRMAPSVSGRRRMARHSAAGRPKSPPSAHWRFLHPAWPSHPAPKTARCGYGTSPASADNSSL